MSANKGLIDSFLKYFTFNQLPHKMRIEKVQTSYILCYNKKKNVPVSVDIYFYHISMFIHFTLWKVQEGKQAKALGSDKIYISFQLNAVWCSRTSK